MILEIVEFSFVQIIQTPDQLIKDNGIYLFAIDEKKLVKMIATSLLGVKGVCSTHGG